MATTDLAKLVVKLEAQAGQYKKELDRAETKLERYKKKTKSQLKGIKTAFVGAFAAIGIGAFVKKIADATSAQESALKQLEATWKSTGGAVGLSVDEMVKDAKRLQAATIFADEEIIKAQSQLATFTNITTETFKEATAAALDLSVKMDQSLQTSIVQLGKALNDPIRGMSALAETGIQFTEDQKELVKELQESGRMMEAQKLILAELETQFGGSAEAARDTFGGALKGLDNAFGDLLEADSMGGAIDGIEELTKLLQDPKTVAAAGMLANAIIKSMELAAKAVTKVVDSMQSLGEGMAKIIHGRNKLDIEDLLHRVSVAEDELKKALNSQDERRIAQWRRVLGKVRLELTEAQQVLGLIRDIDPFKKDESGGGMPSIGQGGEPGQGNASQDDGDPFGFTESQDVFSVSDETMERVQEDLNLLGDIRQRYRDNELKRSQTFINFIESLEEKSGRARIRSAYNFGRGMLAAMSTHSKKAFKVTQALGLAEAAVSLPSAVLKAWDRGGGWPVGAVFAAATLAEGLARIKEIKGAKFDGGGGASFSGVSGGSAPSVNASAPAINTLDRLNEGAREQDPRTQTNITIVGDVFDDQGLIDRVADALAVATQNSLVRISDESGRLLAERT